MFKANFYSSLYVYVQSQSMVVLYSNALHCIVWYSYCNAYILYIIPNWNKSNGKQKTSEKTKTIDTYGILILKTKIQLSLILKTLTNNWIKQINRK